MRLPDLNTIVPEVCRWLWLGVLFTTACSEPPVEVKTLKHYPLDTLDDLVSRSGVDMDTVHSSDGNGSLHVSVTAPTTVRLYETGDIDIENARLVYRARLRTKNVTGQVYLEMWCNFPGKGEFFSRALHSPLSGTHEWSSQETPFFLQAGDNPDNVKLNLVVDGTGEVWIDDVQLQQAPLH